MEEINAKSIFSPATGYILRGGFDWTCNPYVGCTYGCSFCYAAFLPQNRRPLDDWGKWIQAKINAVELARKHGHKLAGKCVFISSVTDPYVPLEKTLALTRGILEAIQPFQPRLLIQTRGPLVVRDIDVLRQFRSLRVNLSIPTDCEEVRKAFEPKAPPLERRWQALAELKDEGIPIGICVTPMLPIRDPATFVDRIRALAPAVLVTQEFHEVKGGFGASTGQRAVAELSRWNWTADNYRDCVERLRVHLTTHEAEAGFFPPPAIPLLARQQELFA